jgi:hypothetical protein
MVDGRGVMHAAFCCTERSAKICERSALIRVCPRHGAITPRGDGPRRTPRYSTIPARSPATLATTVGPDRASPCGMTRGCRPAG